MRLLLAVFACGCVIHAMGHPTSKLHRQHSFLRSRQQTRHQSRALEETQTVVVFSDVEGKEKYLESLLTDAGVPPSVASKPSEAKPPALKLYHLGDMFDPKEGHIQSKVLDKLDNVEVIYGNRDLNKLRFITEFSSKYIDFMTTPAELGHGIAKTLEKGIQNLRGALLYVMLRLYYWSIHPNRTTQIKSEVDWNQLIAIFQKRTKKPEAEEAWFAEYAQFLGLHTLGAGGPCYTKKQFGIPESDTSSTQAAIHTYFSSNPVFKAIMERGSIAVIDDTSGSKMLLAHSGLGDGDFMDDKNLERKNLPADPYLIYGDSLEAAINSVNMQVRDDVKSAFSTSDPDQKLVETLRKEIGDLYRSVRMAVLDVRDVAFLDSVLEYVLTQMLRHFQTKPPDPTPWPLWRTLFTDHLPKTTQTLWFHRIWRKAAQYLSTSLERPGELAMDSALGSVARVYPKKHSGDEKQVPFSPSLTGNNNVLFYLKLLTRFNDYVNSLDEAKKPGLAHICNLANAGIDTVVLGHFAAPGPLVMKFKKEEVKTLCPGSALAHDLAIAFIDPTTYPTKLEVAKKGLDHFRVSHDKALLNIKWVYLHRDGPVRKLRIMQEHTKSETTLEHHIYEMNFDDVHTSLLKEDDPEKGTIFKYKVTRISPAAGSGARQAEEEWFIGLEKDCSPGSLSAAWKTPLTSGST